MRAGLVTRNPGGEIGSRPLLVARDAPNTRDKLRRALWRAVWVALFLPSPIPFHSWRRLLVRLFGGRVGQNVAIYPSVKIWAPWNLEIADDATIGGGCELYSVDVISIGEGVIISQGAFLCSASHDFQSADFGLITGRIEIGANVWVAAQAFIGPGVCISDGAVVGARCVVTRNVGERVILAGNPGRQVGMRNADARNFLAK